MTFDLAQTQQKFEADCLVLATEMLDAARAEIIRLTARVAELEGDAAEFRSAAMWTKHAAEALDGYEADYGEPLPLIHEIGRIPDSRKTASFRIYPNHIRGLADLLKPRAALSTHTEEPKT